MAWVKEEDKPVVIPFTGINNISDPTTLKLGQCVDIVNCDVDSGTLVRRSGYTQLKTADTVINNITIPGVAITGVTSGWSNGIAAYCVKGEKICSFDGEEVTELLGTTQISINPDTGEITTTNLTTPDVLTNTEFVQVNNIIVYSDGVVIGTIENNEISVFSSTTTLSTDEDISDHVADSMPVVMGEDVDQDVADAFEFITPAGICLDFYNGQLFYAKDNFVYCTEAYDIEHIDIRSNVVGGFADNITMIKHVDDGLYVGTTKATYFISGTNVESGFEARQIANKGVIYGTAIHIQADYIPALQSKGQAVLWASPLGIFAATAGGQYVNLSLNTVALPGGSAGCAMFIEKYGQYKYVTCYSSVTGAFANRYADEITKVEQTWSVDLATGGHSRYTNYPFTSLFRFDNNYYGTSNGIFLLGGIDDNSSAIDSYAITAAMDFGTRNLKYIHDLYMSARSEGTLSVDLIVDEELTAEDFDFVFCDHTTAHQRRVKLPKGIKGTYWQFKVKNLYGSDFTVKEISMSPIVSQRIKR